MSSTATLRARAGSFALASLLALAPWGCGSKTPDTSDAVVITDPTVTVPAANAPAANSPGATPSSPASAPEGKAANTSSTASGSPSAPSGKAEGWGSLKGQVVFGGDAPDEPPLVPKGEASKDPQVCAKNGPIPSERLIVNKGNKGVKFALVYIPKPTAISDDAKKAASQATIEFDQKNCVFEPHVLAVMANAKIVLKSSDPVNHNVNAKLKNSSFNSLLASGQSIPFVPSAAERTPGEVTCDIHPWMKAWWLVLDSPYFAVTDEKGQYEIKNVPAGNQKVVVWQESVQKGGFVTAPSGQEVAIKADGTTDKDFTIDPGKVMKGK